MALTDCHGGQAIVCDVAQRVEGVILGVGEGVDVDASGDMPGDSDGRESKKHRERLRKERACTPRHVVGRKTRGKSREN